MSSRVGVWPSFEHDDQQRALVPFRMGDADHRGLGDVGMADGEVLDVDRGNPFAAGLDDVLGAVGDLHVAVGIDGGDVAGVEIAVLVEDLAALALEIGLRDRGAARPSAGRSVLPSHGSSRSSSSVIFISTPNGA